MENIVTANSSRATLTNQVELLLSRLYPPVDRERRHEDRVAIPVLFRLTPLDADRQTLEQAAMVVVGKNISRRGISFYHEHPMAHRRAIIELADPAVGSFIAEVDVTWCRFTKPGWYESGGRLVRSAIPNAQSSTIDESKMKQEMPDFLSQLTTLEDIVIG